MSKELLAANLEVKRFQIMEAFKRNPDSIAAPVVYAADKRIAPVEHNTGAIEAYGFDPFNEIYQVNQETVQKIANYLNEIWLSEDYSGARFDRLEDAFGGYRAMRMELAYTLRYFRLCGLFSDDFFKAVMEGAPIETHSVMEEYTVEEIYLD